MQRLSATYVLPLKRESADGLAELTEYLKNLSTMLSLIVIDNSTSERFAQHHELWKSFATHLVPDRDCVTPNPKVGNVTTGVRRASTEAIIVADDDVRYSAAALQDVVGRLSRADIVRPANYFSPLVWHVCLDTARILLNRVSAGDWPGTLAFRKSTFLRCGGYAGHVLFENFELVRSIVRSGGTELNADDLFVLRLPPESRHFWSQRVRQAYDEFARPTRLGFSLTLVPAVLWCLKKGRWSELACGALAFIALAEIGRRRHGGAQYFPAVSAFLAPLWLLERGVSSWLAVYARVFRGGVSYGGGRLKDAAT